MGEVSTIEAPAMQRNRKLKSRSALLLGSALAAAAAYGATWISDREAEPPAVATLSGALCMQPQSVGTDRKVFFRLAAATTEVRPFQDVPSTDSNTASSSDDPPLFPRLGTLHYPISTSNPLAQQYFDQGIRLALAFNHAEARRAFRKAQRLDPACAMCFWGEAQVLGPNINMPMEQSVVGPAVAASRRAGELKTEATPVEQGLIDALATRYSREPNAERAALDTAYANAMQKLAARYPKDTLVAVLYAESLMDLTPWDYWDAGGSRPKGRTAEILATLERVLQANPNHPGAIHFYIHMVEASSRPQRATPYARRLGAAMPGAGHLVHMPFHIYYRVGLFKDAIAANKAAVAADEAYIAQAQPQGIYPRAYYPHNVHSLLVSAQMAGDGRIVLDAATKLDRIVSTEAAFEIPWVQPIKAAPYFAHAQFSDPSTVLSLRDPGNGLPYVKAMWHYARGVAFAAQGNPDAATGESAAILALEQSADFGGLEAGGIPAKQVLRVARHVVDARTAQAQGDLGQAVAELDLAVALEDQLAYMEPPFWYYPLRQSLGATKLMAGDDAGAETAFRTILSTTPQNGWALYGLAEVYRKRGDTRSARAVEKRLQQAWIGDSSRLSLARL
jgi:tetratricopeptide (TPR) repeat protein